MKNKVIQTALILTLAFLFLSVATLVIFNSSLTNPADPTPWRPAGLATETQVLTPTHGWWDDLPAPKPVYTATPTPEGTP